MKRALLSLGLAALLASAASAQVFYDFTANNGGWTPGGSGGTAAAAWAHGNPGNPGPGTDGWFTPGQNNVGTYFVASPVMFVISAGQVTGSFLHRFNLESGFDGGQVQFRTNGGAWETITQDLITGVTYGSTISSGFSSPIGGQRAFSGTSLNYATGIFQTSSFTLGTGASPFSTGTPTNFAVNDQVEFRFFGAWDVSVVNTSPNWHVVNSSFNNLQLSPIPEPTTLLLGGLGIAGAGLGVRRIRARRSAKAKADAKPVQVSDTPTGGRVVRKKIKVRVG